MVSYEVACGSLASHIFNKKTQELSLLFYKTAWGSRQAPSRLLFYRVAKQAQTRTTWMKATWTQSRRFLAPLKVLLWFPLWEETKIPSVLFSFHCYLNLIRLKSSSLTYPFSIFTMYNSDMNHCFWTVLFK